MRRLLPAFFLLSTLTACMQVKVHGDPAAYAGAPAMRVATYNTSLYSEEAGGLIRELEGDSLSLIHI